MDNVKFQRIKQKALNEGIPIIMDDTLAYLDSLLLDSDKENILEIRNSSPDILLFVYQNIFLRLDI